MSFISNFLAMFHRKPQASAASGAPVANTNTGTGYMTNGGNAAAAKRNKNVYDEARHVPVPDWAQGLNNTDLTAQLRQHVTCKYAPNFGWKKIMTPLEGPDGNLVAEYDGIAGDCGAVKSFGLKVAQRDGRTMAYKYVDLNMAYRCCCGIPKKCPFYLQAIGEMEQINQHRT